MKTVEPRAIAYTAVQVSARLLPGNTHFNEDVRFDLHFPVVELGGSWMESSTMASSTTLL